MSAGGPAGEYRMRERPTLMDGLVVEWCAPGLCVSASRSKVVVHDAECRSAEDDERLDAFLEVARRERDRLRTAGG